MGHLVRMQTLPFLPRFRDTQIASELSCEKTISPHIKTTGLLLPCEKISFYGYIINDAFFSESEMGWLSLVLRKSTNKTLQ